MTDPNAASAEARTLAEPNENARRHMAEILNKIPEVDPHDDEAWLVDVVFLALQMGGRSELVLRAAFAGAAPPQPPTVEEVEAEIGMGNGAWDMVDPDELIRAVLKLAAAERPRRTIKDAAGEPSSFTREEAAEAVRKVASERPQPEPRICYCAGKDEGGHEYGAPGCAWEDEGGQPEGAAPLDARTHVLFCDEYHQHTPPRCCDPKCWCRTEPKTGIAAILERAEGMYAEAQGYQHPGLSREWHHGYAEACRDLLGDLRALSATPPASPRE